MNVVQRCFDVVSTSDTDVVPTLCNVENPTSDFVSFCLIHNVETTLIHLHNHPTWKYCSSVILPSGLKLGCLQLRIGASPIRSKINISISNQQKDIKLLFEQFSGKFQKAVLSQMNLCCPVLLPVAHPLQHVTFLIHLGTL